MSTMRATISLQGGVRFTAEAGSGHTLIIDGPLEAGGENAGFRPMELMLLGLGGCLAYDVLMILRRMREDVTGYQLNLVGERAEDPPSVHTTVTLEHIVTGKGISESSLKRALSLAESKYCSASAMFAKTARLIHTVRVIEAGT